MLSLAPEIEQLRPHLGDTLTHALAARERREVFSIHPELRILAWVGAMLLATSAGLVLKKHYEQIGPLAIALLIALAAAGCYAWVWWRRSRASLVDDYILLLGALLVSADVAFIESQFHLLGDSWHRHFLIVAVFHAVGAYVFDSRTLLSLAITALGAWMGLRDGAQPDDGIDFARSAWATAALVMMWRIGDARLRQPRGSGQRPAEASSPAGFAEVFDHFIANLALAGSLALAFEDSTRVIGSFLTIAVATVVITWGFQKRRESFVLYAFVYAVIAADVFLFEVVRAEVARLLILIASTIGAIVALFFIHARFREQDR